MNISQYFLESFQIYSSSFNFLFHMCSLDYQNGKCEFHLETVENGHTVMKLKKKIK